MRHAQRIASSVVLIAFSLALASATTAQQHNRVTADEATAGWALIFDGASLTGWAPRLDGQWEVADGTISAVPDAGRGFMATTSHYADFQLTVDFWIDDTANSGVFLRCPAEGAISQGNAFEVNIFDPHTTWPTGSINEVAKIQTVPQTAGKWNTFEITADGDHLVVQLNGQTTVDARSDRHQSGPIALQYNGAGQVRFRNIKIKTLE